MALGLVGKAGRGEIWVGLSSVMSKEAPIPPAPGCEAAQPNHANPTDDVVKRYTESCLLSKSAPVPPYFTFLQVGLRERVYKMKKSARPS